MPRSKTPRQDASEKRQAGTDTRLDNLERVEELRGQRRMLGVILAIVLAGLVFQTIDVQKKNSLLKDVSCNNAELQIGGPKSRDVDRQTIPQYAQLLVAKANYLSSHALQSLNCPGLAFEDRRIAALQDVRRRLSHVLERHPNLKPITDQLGQHVTLSQLAVPPERTVAQTPPRGSGDGSGTKQPQTPTGKPPGGAAAPSDGSPGSPTDTSPGPTSSSDGTLTQVATGVVDGLQTIAAGGNQALCQITHPLLGNPCP